jgi:Holliday junction resolvase
LKPERKFWLELKKKTPNIIWTRIENLALPGVPDLLGYNKNYTFFTVELKVTKGKKIRFSPHQIAFHIRHPKNTFILVKSLASSCVKLYEGHKVLELAACGLKLEAYREGLEACRLHLEQLGA